MIHKIMMILSRATLIGNHCNDYGHISFSAAITNLVNLNVTNVILEVEEEIGGSKLHNDKL